MKNLYLLISLLISAQFARAQEPDTTITLDSTILEVRVVADSLELPWDLVWGPDNKIWFTERNGAVKRLDPESGVVEFIHHFNDVHPGIENAGLHSMSLHPDFPMTPYVYFQYTFGDYSSKVVRLSYDENTNTLQNQEDVIPFMNANSSHNGSRMQWDDDDKLMVCVGDAYTELVFPQQVHDLPGKVLRMNPDGTAPSDNPIPGSLVWSWGHRNPQGLVIASNGKIYSSEHGPHIDDELNIIEKGRNYGWPYVWGFCDEATTHYENVQESVFCVDSNIVEPLMVWSPTQAPCGLEYYDHPAIPEWQNALLLCFLKEQRLKFLKLNVDGDEVIEEVDHLDHMYGRMRDVLKAPDGRVFVCTSNSDHQNPFTPVDRIYELKNPDFTIDIPKTEISNDMIRIIPNPSSGDFYVELPEVREVVNYGLIDAIGKIVKTGSVRTDFSGFIFERESFESGMYLLRIETSIGTFEKRVVLN